MKSTSFKYSLYILYTFVYHSHNVIGHEGKSFSTEIKKCDNDERQQFPNTCGLIDRALHEPNNLMKEIVQWGEYSGYIDNRTNLDGSVTRYPVKPVGDNGFTFEGDRTDVLPIVSQHGLFGSCFMFPLPDWVKLAAETTGGYATCINLGDSAIDEILNTVFLNMDKSIDEFARKIRANPIFANGFNALGFSQGNAVIRGYIVKYNDPPVKNFISVDGVCAGVSSLPHCNPYDVNATFGDGSHHTTSLRTSRSLVNKHDPQGHKTMKHICMLFEEISSELAYTTFIQQNIFPANYFIDPHPDSKDKFLEFSLQAKISNEGSHFNETYKENFLSVDNYVWIMALDDTTVIPREGEHWGHVDSHNFSRIIPMKETEWFKSDSFGLRSAYNEGKFTFRNHSGYHVQIPPKQYQSLIEEFFL